MSYEVPQQKARLRPKYSTKNKTDRAVKDTAYLNWFAKQAFPCYECNAYEGVEGHHIKRDSTDRKDDTLLLPLCYKHHHGTGLSPHGTPKKWRARYPYDVQVKSANTLYDQYIKEMML